MQRQSEMHEEHGKQGEYEKCMGGTKIALGTRGMHINMGMETNKEHTRNSEDMWNIWANDTRPH